MAKKDFSIQPKHTSIDTETIGGKVVLMCTPNIDRMALYLPKDFEQIALYLFNTKDHEAHNIWTFNLTYDATAILKFLPEENLKEIYESNKTQYGDFSIFYIPGKLFSITLNNRKSTLVDAAQFFGGLSLDKAAEIYLNDRKKSNDIIENFKKQEGKTEEELYKYLEDNKEVLIQYCKYDAYLTAELGRKIDQSCYDIYGFRLETYSSNAKIGEKMTLYYLEKETNKKGLRTTYQDKNGKDQKSNLFPQALENSRPCLFAKMAFRGGIFETWQRGSFKEVTDLDINSAYPYEMVKLPHWANGEFLELTNEMIFNIETGKETYIYGWVACTFDCGYIPYDSKVEEKFELIYQDETFEVEASNTKIYYPTGTRQQIITLAEYYFMKKYGFKCTLDAGYIWKQINDRYVNPFSWMPSIFEKKSEIKRRLGKESKKDMNYLMCKIGANGTYGKTVQKIGDIEHKPLFSPFYGSYITANCRIKIASFILDNKLEKDVLAIATDGILLKGDHTHYPSGEALGEWDINRYDSALVIGNGMLQLVKSDKEGKLQNSTRMRGVTNNQKIDIISLLTEIKDKDEWENVKFRPLKLGETLMHHKKFKINDMNKFIRFGKKLRVNADTKRNWKQLKNFGELLNTQIVGKRWTVKEIEAMKPIKKLSDVDEAIKILDEQLNRKI